MQMMWPPSLGFNYAILAAIERKMLWSEQFAQFLYFVQSCIVDSFSKLLILTSAFHFNDENYQLNRLIKTFFTDSQTVHQNPKKFD